MKKFIAQLGFVFGFSALVLSSCGSKQEKSPVPTEIGRPLASELEVYWELKENGYKNQGKSLTSFTIKNNSAKTLKQNWELFFHQPRKVVPGSAGDNVEVSHVNGDYFKLNPTDKFVELKTGESISIDFVNEAWFLKEVDAPSGIYIVFSKNDSVEYSPESIENITILPIAKGELVAIDGNSSLEIPTSISIYAENEENEFVHADSICPITPSPVSYSEEEGGFELLAGSSVAFEEQLASEGQFLIEKFKADFGFDLIQGNSSPAIELVIDTALVVDGKSSEVYELIVDDNVLVKGSDAAGVFYGIQSLRALVNVKAFNKNESNVSLRKATVKDAPRFQYRGMHLDVVRNFQKKESVLRLIDMMAFYKLNKFHFHISDDEGWRLEIEGLPELTEVGSRRGHSADESEMINPAYGSGPNPSEDSHGTGHYSKDDFIEILKYAKKRHIEVIPELDFPGHARAAIISMKARQKRLLKEGKKEEANQYILHDANDSSKYTSIQLYNDNVICVCQESTYAFLEKVVDEVVALYAAAGLKLDNVHTGGDEVPHSTEHGEGVWTKSPLCQSFLAESEKYNSTEDLFYYFVDRFSSILQKKDIVTSGWEEIGLKKELNEEEEVVPVVNQEFISRNFHPYIWNTVWTWGAEDRGYKLANAGYKVVLANVNNLYFDLAYDKDPTDPGYYWGGFVNTKKAWNFVPLNFYTEKIVDRWGNEIPDSVSLQAIKERLTEAGKENVLGIQGQLWAETVKGQDMMEYYIFPKMLGLVERAWAKDPKWASISEKTERAVEKQKAWNDFLSKVGQFELQRLTYFNGGYHYRIAPAGAVIKGGKLHVNTLYPGFEIRYTTDGSAPTVTSTLYSGPVDVPAGVEIQVKVFNTMGRSSRTTVLR